MSIAYTQKVVDFLTHKTISDQVLIDITFYYDELEQIVNAPASYISELQVQRKLNAPPLPKKLKLKKVSEPKPTKPKREHYESKKPKMVNTYMPYEERLALEGYKKLDFRTRTLTSKHKPVQ